MNAIAIWWEKRGSGSSFTPSLHLDVNLWITNKKNYFFFNSKENYIEFGFKLTDFQDIQNINIFLPYMIEKKCIVDKTNDLIDSTELTNALFNENLTVENNNNGVYHKVHNSDGTIKFYYYDLTIENDIKVQSYKDDHNNVGTIITINIQQYNGTPDSNKLYTRLRINKLENIYNTTYKNYMYLDGFAEEHSTVEFNLNTVRKLSNNITHRMLVAPIKLTSMNLFLMTDAYADITQKTEDLEGTRILENRIWNEYLANRSIDKVVAYHWKVKEEFSHYNLFIKTTFTKKSFLMLLFVILAIIFLGTMGGITGSYVYDKYDLAPIKDTNQTVNNTKVDKKKDSSNKGTKNKQAGDSNGTL